MEQQDVVKKSTKKDVLDPRLAAKLKELESRGILTNAKAHVCPQELSKLNKPSE